MTIDRTGGQNDDILAAVAGLRTPDVSQQRARQLRRRCHAGLQAQAAPKPSAALVTRTNGTVFRRLVGPALGGAWCLAYLVELVRRAAALYLSTQ